MWGWKGGGGRGMTRKGIGGGQAPRSCTPRGRKLGESGKGGGGRGESESSPEQKL